MSFLNAVVVFLVWMHLLFGQLAEAGMPLVGIWPGIFFVLFCSVRISFCPLSSSFSLEIFPLPISRFHVSTMSVCESQALVNVGNLGCSTYLCVPSYDLSI
jgi:hypothetical protein